jgi:hypothetical protein
MLVHSHLGCGRCKLCCSAACLPLVCHDKHTHHTTALYAFASDVRTCPAAHSAKAQQALVGWHTHTHTNTHIHTHTRKMFRSCWPRPTTTSQPPGSPRLLGCVRMAAAAVGAGRQAPTYDYSSSCTAHPAAAMHTHGASAGRWRRTGHGCCCLLQDTRTRTRTRTHTHACTHICKDTGTSCCWCSRCCWASQHEDEAKAHHHGQQQAGHAAGCLVH